MKESVTVKFFLSNVVSLDLFHSHYTLSKNRLTSNAYYPYPLVPASLPLPAATPGSRPSSHTRSTPCRLTDTAHSSGSRATLARACSSRWAWALGLRRPRPTTPQLLLLPLYRITVVLRGSGKHVPPEPVSFLPCSRLKCLSPCTERATVAELVSTVITHADLDSLSFLNAASASVASSHVPPRPRLPAPPPCRT